MDQTVLKRISSWGKFVGILMIIVGVLTAISGLFAFIVGAIPGVIMIIMAVYIYKSAKSADEYLHAEDGEALYRLLDYYGRFLLLSGIIYIIYIAMFVISIILFFIFGIAAINELNNFN